MTGVNWRMIWWGGGCGTWNGFRGRTGITHTAGIRTTIMSMGSYLTEENKSPVVRHRRRAIQFPADGSVYRPHLRPLRHQKNPTQQCSRCKVASYCNRECQVAHWAVHTKHALQQEIAIVFATAGAKFSFFSLLHKHRRDIICL